MSLNKVILMGRITQAPELRQTQSGTAFLPFSIAVNRYSKDGEQLTDFISCTAWGKTAEFIAKYFGKGRMIAVTGRLQTRSYEDNSGVTRHITEVNVEQADFTGEPKQGSQSAYNSAYNSNYAEAGPAAEANSKPQNSAQGVQSKQDIELDEFDGGLFDGNDGVPF